MDMDPISQQRMLAMNATAQDHLEAFTRALRRTGRRIKAESSRCSWRGLVDGYYCEVNLRPQKDWLECATADLLKFTCLLIVGNQANKSFPQPNAGWDFDRIASVLVEMRDQAALIDKQFSGLNPTFPIVARLTEEFAVEGWEGWCQIASDDRSHGALEVRVAGLTPDMARRVLNALQAVLGPTNQKPHTPS